MVPYHCSSTWGRESSVLAEIIPPENDFVGGYRGTLWADSTARAGFVLVLYAVPGEIHVRSSSMAGWITLTVSSSGGFGENDKQQPRAFHSRLIRRRQQTATDKRSWSARVYQRRRMYRVRTSSSSCRAEVRRHSELICDRQFLLRADVIPGSISSFAN